MRKKTTPNLRGNPNREKPRAEETTEKFTIDNIYYNAWNRENYDGDLYML